MDQEKKEAEAIKERIEGYPKITWEEVLSSGFNCVWNSDNTGTRFEGEIESIKREGDRIILRCKWMNILEPYFDEDGDIDSDKMEWKPGHLREVSFSSNDTPRKMPDTSNVIIQKWLGQNFSSGLFTTTSLGMVKDFKSLKSKLDKQGKDNPENPK